MSFGSIKRRPADILYSKFLRQLRKFTCEKCSRRYRGDEGLYGLQVSHFYGRAKESVRFDLENTDLLCAGCHRFFTANPNEYVEWKRKRMGDQRFKLLTLRAHTPGKKDDVKILLWLKKEMEK